MRAAIYPGGGKPIVLETLPDPEPAPGEILVRVQRCGICGSDLSMTKGEAWDYAPGQFGHEYAGEVVARGKGAERLPIGARVAVIPALGCGHCPSCSGGDNPIICASPHPALGGFSELVAIPEAVAVALPQTLSLADGALIEPLAVGLYGMRRSGLAKGETVLVLGGGTVALYAIYWARRMGAGRVVAASRSTRRRDLCLQMGADAFVTFGENELGEAMEALGGMPDVVIEAVGIEGMLDKAVLHARPYGRVISLGFCTHPDPMLPAMASYKCVTVQFLVGYTPAEFRYIANEFDKGHIDPATILTRTVPLGDLPATMDLLRGPNADTKVHVDLST
jgi:threonine dehydrogenase-like Zn-dependent dehydrogenase